MFLECRVVIISRQLAGEIDHYWSLNSIIKRDQIKGIYANLSLTQVSIWSRLGHDRPGNNIYFSNQKLYLYLMSRGGPLRLKWPVFKVFICFSIFFRRFWRIVPKITVDHVPKNDRETAIYKRYSPILMRIQTNLLQVLLNQFWKFQVGEIFFGFSAFFLKFQKKVSKIRQKSEKNTLKLREVIQ